MGKFLEFIKDEASLLLRNKKNLTSLLILGILILALPILKSSLEKQKIIQSRATEDPIVFVAGDGVSQREDGTWVSTNTKVALQLNSPLGPAGSSSVPNPTAVPTIAPTAVPTIGPTQAPVSWSANLLRANMQNRQITSNPTGDTQWFGPGTYTLSGTVTSTPRVPVSQTLAAISADEWTDDNQYVTWHDNNTTFTVPAGHKTNVLLRVINADASFTNVSFVEAVRSQNLLVSKMQNATLRDDPAGDTQWFGPGTYTLSGTVTSTPRVPVSQTLAAISADEWTDDNQYVTWHDNNTTFTVPAGHKTNVLLRVINADASFTNVSLKKQQ